MPEPPTESLGQIHSVRRSVTLPTKLNPQAQRGSGAPNLGENVIFYHPTAKIVHFAPRSLVPIPSSSTPTDFDYPVDTIETLPWRSATERTVATAPLRLEKVHGLTVFLKCGNVVHAILKNSQCWCVDGVSKFVLRIRPLTYYRIEIPHETEHDKSLVEDLKAALPTVLRYEVTPCPFKRAFTVEIPEDAMAPRRKRAWKPKGRTEGMTAVFSSIQGSPSDKSEWLDSASTASTGEDTDGAATDDSGFGARRANITTSEAVSTENQSPTPAHTIELSVHSRLDRRSVTETPQTFTSLRAKFDLPPTSERATTPENPARETETTEESGQSQASPSVPGPNAAVGTQEPTVRQERPVTKEPKSGGDTGLEDTTPPVTQVSRIAVDDVTHQPQIVGSVIDQATGHATSIQRDITVSDAASEEESSVPEKPTLVDLSQEEASIQKPSSAHLDKFDPSVRDCLISEDVASGTMASASATQELTPSKQATDPGGTPEEDDAGSEPEFDHDASFSSSPDSFHSADLSSPSDSVSTHTLPEDTRDMAQRAQASPQGLSVPLREKAARFDSIETASPPPESSPPVYGILNKDGNPAASSSFVYYEARADSSNPSLMIPSDSRRPSQPGTKASSPTTDFNHMSTEFRRRSQATRQREVSPMPPPSAIYQPSPNEEATSLLSKALTLVLVPPVSLFIILLHITARIVISPALGSGASRSAKGPRAASSEAVTEDDFSFPLEQEASSDYEDAEINRKLDPWDLD